VDNSPLEYSIDGLFFGANPIFMNLPAGIFQVFVQDSFGCVVSQQIVIPNFDGPQIVDIQIYPDYCGLDNGGIEITASSSTSNLLYSIDGFTFIESNTFSGLQSGGYQIVVQDSNGCEIEQPIEIPAVDATLIESLIITDAGCESTNGTIEIVPTLGEVTGYSLDRLNFQLSPYFDSVSQGNYTVYLLSHDICLDSTVASIFQKQGPSISEVQISNPICPKDLGKINILAEGESDLTFSIDGGITWGIHSNIDNLIPGDYSVFVRDSFGCIDSQIIHISDPNVLAISKVETVPAICNSGGRINVYAIGDSLNYRLNETITSPDGSFSNLEAGNYRLSIYDKYGCFLDTMLTITESKCGIYMSNVFSPNGDGMNDHFGPQFPSENYHQGIFEVYDRWGTAVFTCNQTNECSWDGMFKGKQSPVGVYAWRLVYTDIKGENQILTGDVTLIR
jgi:gliding motility-associated-like protein